MFSTPRNHQLRHALVLRFCLAIVTVVFASAAFAADLVLEIGGSGSGDGEFSEVNGIAVARDGRIFVVDAGNARVQVFNPDGSFAYHFGSFGVGPGEFDIGVCGVLINDELERLYVSEGIPGGANHRIQAFDLDGTFRFEFGSPGTAAGEFDSPCQMALGPDDELYVVDRGNHRVQAFDSLGGFILEFGTSGSADGEFNLPSGIAIDRSGRVFVADSFSPRIQVFDFAGAFLESFGAFGTAPGQFDRPCHLAQGGTLMVADALNERIQVFTLAGHFQLEFPVTGTPQSIFCSNVPTGLATDRLGRIYVEEGDFVRVYSIDRDGDGLLDLWETSGLDADADGVVDLSLHQAPYNADPDHKDLYLEFDWHMRSPVASHVIREMKEVFCAAPVDAGGVANPDGEPGIRLHVDTGSLTDPGASENPRTACSCRDGVDNNGDGLVDGADPSCFVLDPAGGEGGAGFVTCGDDLDNDGDGDVDGNDSDCPLVYDEFAMEFTATAAQCGDGVDNDGDGNTDGDDPDCAVGDDLGGGTVLVDAVGDPLAADICDFDATYYAAKNDNFDPARAMVFRYALQVPNCDIDGDGESDSRSRAELGGNDTFHATIAAADLPPRALISSSNYVHELGHNLNLTHGGLGADNCEPNYVSIMNYDTGFGIRRVVPLVGTGTYDFSPPRFPGGRGNAPLPAGSPDGTLDENDLDERLIMDPANRLHQFVFVNAVGEKIRSPLDGDVDGDGVPDGTDWDGDGAVTDAAGLAVNVDTSGPAGTPEECFNTSLEVLTGHDDWFNMSLPFRQVGNLSDAPLNPTVTPEPTLAEQVAHETALNTADLALVLAAAANPVEAGDAILLTATTDNLGPNPADRVALGIDVGATAVSLPPACQPDIAGVSCDFGPLPAGTFADLQISLSGADVCSGGAPSPVTIEAAVENVSEFAGDDPDPGNNLAELTVDVVDTTAPAIDCNLPASAAPPNAPITITAMVDDFCDGAATATIGAVACYAIKPSGERIDLPCRSTSDGGSLHIRNSGGVGTYIEWTVQAADGSGNEAETECLLEVGHPGD